VAVAANDFDRAAEGAAPCDSGSPRAAVEPFLVTVVLADEQPVVRQGLRALLSGPPEVAVVADAATARDAMRLVVLHRPCVLVIDIELPGFQVDGTIREVLRAAPSTAVLVFTADAAEDTVVAAVRAGARGYLLKSSSGEGIVRAVRGLAAGEAVLGPGVTDRLVSRIGNRPAQHQELFPELSPRERDVLELMASGMRNAAIAARLHLSPKTVANRISLIFSKLQVADRAEAIELVQQGWRGRAGGSPLGLIGGAQFGPAPGLAAVKRGRHAVRNTSTVPSTLH
jgi:DNA-binding NarL/FixJ family response regulator